MKKNSLFLVIFMFSLNLFSQKETDVLATLNGESLLVKDFKRIYEKNLNAIDNKEAKDVKKNLDLFINFKLKVKEAFQLNLDTMVSYKREIETYKNQLIAPYLSDKSHFNSLVEEAYQRTKTEIRASHILVRFPKNYTSSDTLKYYNKILEIRNRIIAGEDFETVAREMSEDPSAQYNGGDLGFFSAFKMLYNFEDIAYKTPFGKVSQPFKTRYGYHIVKNTGSRLSRGEIQVAHIIISDTTNNGKLKIDQVHAKIKEGVKFKILAKEFSNDLNTKNKGGVLPKFGSGRMVKPFEDIAFSLNSIGQVSEPFKTRYGWHIVKLLKQFPVLSFEITEKDITDKVRKSGRAKLSDNVVLDKLKNEYKIEVDENAKNVFQSKDVRKLSKDSLQNTLITINDKKITQSSFLSYISNRRNQSIDILFDNFLNSEILNYFKENLVYTNSDFAETLQEYREGLLLFELMQQKIWNKSSDSIVLKNYFDSNSKNYENKTLETIKGKVMNDFQSDLELNWIERLRAENEIKINQKVLKKLIKYYRKES